MKQSAIVQRNLVNVGQSHGLDIRSMSMKERKSWCENWLADRDRGRTDLLWLCNEVLQYKDVEPIPHGPVIDHVQHFRGREEYMDPETMTLIYSEPRCAMHEDGDFEHCPPTCIGRTIWHLDGPHFRMLLDPRGHLKTTVNTISHGAQWVINFEDIRIALSVATSQQGADIITEVENHFRYNDVFRFLYPECCPQALEAGRWGSKEEFTVPNRRRKWLKEPTMRVISVGKVVAGPHYDVIKCSDLVDKENVKTDGGLREVKDHFKYMMPLLERGPKVEGRDLTRGWIDLEGTIYHHSDLYVEELEKDEKRIKEGRSCRWAVMRRDAIIDEKLRKTLWEKRFPWEELQAILEDMDEYTFNCQYRLNPYSRSAGLCTRDQFRLFSHKAKEQVIANAKMIKCTIDLAGMEEDSEGANTAITVAVHDSIGRKYVVEANVGKPNPSQVVDHIFRIDASYGTKFRKVKFVIEKNHHAQVLGHFLELEQKKRNLWLDLHLIPRDNTVSKENRIWGLQSWFKAGLLHFCDDIPDLDHCRKEALHFPKFKYKDFLDSLVDQMQEVDGKVDDQATQHQQSVPDESDPYHQFKIKLKFLGFDPTSKAPVWSGDEGEDGWDEYSQTFGEGHNHGELRKTYSITGAL